MLSYRLQFAVKMRNFIHKGLQQLDTEGKTEGVPPDAVDMLRKMFAFWML